MPPSDRYTLGQLAQLAGVTPRTIRYYLANGLLPSPGQGAGVRYGTGHLGRTRLIKRLQQSHLPLAEIRARLERLSDGEVERLLEAPATPAPSSALDYVRDVLHGLQADASTAPARPRAVQAGPFRAATLDPTRATLALAGASPVPDPAAVPFPPARPAAPGAREASASFGGGRAAESRAPARSQWERISLSADVELHVRRPLDRLTNRRVDRLVAFARQLLVEDQP